MPRTDRTSCGGRDRRDTVTPSRGRTKGKFATTTDELVNSALDAILSRIHCTRRHSGWTGERVARRFLVEVRTWKESVSLSLRVRGREGDTSHACARLPNARTRTCSRERVRGRETERERGKPASHACPRRVRHHACGDQRVSDVFARMQPGWTSGWIIRTRRSHRRARCCRLSFRSTG